MIEEKETVKVYFDVDTFIRSAISRSFILEPTFQGGLTGNPYDGRPKLLTRVFSVSQFIENIQGTIDSVLDKVAEETGTAPQVSLYISQLKNNFYYKKFLSSKYKKNRKKETTNELELYLDYLNNNNFLDAFKGYKVVENIRGIETDDLIGIEASWDANQGVKAIVCSTDKDFKFQFATINPYSLEYQPAKPKELYKLLLTGDAADGIPGIKGYGEAKATKLVDKHEDISSLADEVKDIYDKEGLDVDEFTDLLSPLYYTQFIPSQDKPYKYVLDLKCTTLRVNEETGEIESV